MSYPNRKEIMDAIRILEMFEIVTKEKCVLETISLLKTRIFSPITDEEYTEHLYQRRLEAFKNYKL
jgi:hypothetical protein